MKIKSGLQYQKSSFKMHYFRYIIWNGLEIVERTELYASEIKHS